jgi:hypothetical protein
MQPQSIPPAEKRTPEADEIPLEICDGEYNFVEMVGFGGQGTVCIFEEKSSKQKYAVKFDPLPPTSPNVLSECLFLRDFAT